MSDDIEAALETAMTAEDWVEAAGRWIDAIGDPLPDASPMFKALVDVVKECRRRSTSAAIESAVRQLSEHQMALRVIYELMDEGPGTPSELAERMTEKADDGEVYEEKWIDDAIAIADPFSVFDYPGDLASGVVALRAVRR